MDYISAFIHNLMQALNDFTWSPFMLGAFLTVGALFTIGTGFYQIRCFKEWFSCTFISIFRPGKAHKGSCEKALSPFSTFATAIASSAGTGNIAGVATAIVLGGPGSVLWMWVSSILGMMTIFAENALGIKYRYKNEKGEWIGGAFIYIEKGLGMKFPALIYLIFCILSSFGIGNAVQSNSAADALRHTFDIPPLMSGAVFTLVAGIIIFGGMRAVASANEKIVPFMLIGYIIGGILCILWNIDRLPSAIALIFKEALCVKSAAGGAIGYGISKSMRMGIARGVFSNEAGIGTSALANSFSALNEPAEQGMWGIFQVFSDTIVICTITALVILTSGVFSVDGYVSGEMTATGAALASKAFSSTLGRPGDIFVSVATLFFAFSTIISWSLFGSKCAEYLLGKRGRTIYKIVFTVFIIIGAVTELETVWEITETLNGLMAIPNLAALILLSPKVFAIMREYRRKNPM